MRYILFMLCSWLGATYKPAPIRESNASKVVTSVQQVLAEFTLLFGIAVIVAALYKYSEHRRNPLAHPMGQVVTLLFVGICLVGLYFIPMQTV